MLKHGEEASVKYLTDICNEAWQKAEVPEDWTKDVVIKLPKKGSLSDCNNWSGITLMSTPGKVFSRILLNRIQIAVDATLRENQAGFRKGRSCLEQIFTLRNIIEQSSEYQREITINFIDLKKAFDSVHRLPLWKILKQYGIPDQDIEAFKALYKKSSCCVKTANGYTEFF
jgi:hypothetical protein